MRFFASAIAPALATIGLLCAVEAQAQTDSECQGAFERWAKISAARIVSQSSNGRGACVPSEDVRNGLLDGLALARGICGNVSSEQAAQTKNLLHINQSFISSLTVCPSSESADAGPGWVTRAEKPKVAAPLLAPPPTPAPSRAPVPAPSPPPPRSAAVAPPPALAPAPASPPVPAQPAPAAAGAPPSPPCLDMAPAQNDSVALVYRRCRGHTVLAVIETPGTRGETVCRGYSINYTLAVRAPGARPPRVNYECIAGQGSCNKDRLGDMFPECDW